MDAFVARVDPETVFQRLQMGTVRLSDAYIDEIFNHEMKGLKKR